MSERCTYPGCGKTYDWHFNQFGERMTDHVPQSSPSPSGDTKGEEWKVGLTGAQIAATVCHYVWSPSTGLTCNRPYATHLEGHAFVPPPPTDPSPVDGLRLDDEMIGMLVKQTMQAARKSLVANLTATDTQRVFDAAIRDTLAAWNRRSGR